MDILCCNTASTGDCSVTDEDVGYDEDDCVRNMAGAGQCTGGWGYHIIAYEQSSTHENATGPGTVDVAGCAEVKYTRCQTIFIGLDKGYWWDCIWWRTEHTQNMGTHDECPTE